MQNDEHHAADEDMVGREITLQTETGKEFQAVVETRSGTEMVVRCVVTGTRFHMTRQLTH